MDVQSLKWKQGDGSEEKQGRTGIQSAHYASKDI